MGLALRLSPGMTGPRNLITDVAGLRVGNAHDEPSAAASRCRSVRGADGRLRRRAGRRAGTRETDLLEPERSAVGVDAIVLSGGSGFGLDAASGVQAYLRERGLGIAVGSVRVPLVPQAIVFDLLNGGDKEWGRYPPYRELGYEAASMPAADFVLGTAGGGYGATTSTSRAASARPAP